MLNSLMYRLIRQIKNNKVLSVLTIIMFLVFGINIVLAAVRQNGVQHGVITLGYIRIIAFLTFNAAFLMNITGYIGSYSESDVNYHLAGPFTPRFNTLLILPYTIVFGAAMVFMLNCSFVFNPSQNDMLGLESIDVVFTSVIVLCVSLFGGILGNLLYPLKSEKPILSKLVKYLYILIITLAVGNIIIPLYRQAGSAKEIVRQGFVSAVECCGGNPGLKFFPVTGGIVSLYCGIFYGDSGELLLGIGQTSFYMGGLALLIGFYDLDYYESAVLSAIKETNLKEAMKAGIDPDLVRMTSNIEIGKSTLKHGGGANTFFFKHILEFSRKNRLFFFDKYTLLMRLVAAGCLFVIFASGDELVSNIAVFYTVCLLINMYFSGFIYSGGITVLELNNPYFRIIPENTRKKLLFGILGDVPGMLFDSGVCALIMLMFIGPEIHPLYVVLYIILLVTYDLMSEFIAIPLVKICRHVGRNVVLSLRMLTASVISVLLFVGLVLLVFFAGVGMQTALILFSLLCLVIAVLVLCLSSNIIDSMEI